MRHLIWTCLVASALSVGGWAQPTLTPTSRVVHFQSTNEGIESVRLEIFDLSGQRVFSSGPVPGATYKWHLQRDDGRAVANGVYLYIFLTRTDDSREWRSAVGKLAVRR
jgi:hypothetical protein